jgi:hypothetical protein
MTLDETFLTLHPATAAWYERRPTCLTCANVRSRHGVMRCAVARKPRYGPILAYCIDARLEGQPCGPGAKLYAPRGGLAA